MNKKEEILKVMSAEWGGGYDYIQNMLEVEIKMKDLKKEIQELKADGLIELLYLSSDENKLMGRGFCLTRKGYREQIEILDRDYEVEK